MPRAFVFFFLLAGSLSLGEVQPPACTDCCFVCIYGVQDDVHCRERSMASCLAHSHCAYNWKTGNCSGLQRRTCEQRLAERIGKCTGVIAPDGRIALLREACPPGWTEYPVSDKYKVCLAPPAYIAAALPKNCRTIELEVYAHSDEDSCWYFNLLDGLATGQTCLERVEATHFGCNTFDKTTEAVRKVCELADKYDCQVSATGAIGETFSCKGMITNATFCKIEADGRVPTATPTPTPTSINGPMPNPEPNPK